MPMTANGLAKLIEECGELTQIAGKKMAYYNTDVHPDGKGSMARRLQDEIADVLAACQFVAQNFRLDPVALEERRLHKLALFASWHADVANLPDSDGLIGIAASAAEATGSTVSDYQRRLEMAFEGAFQALARSPENELLLREMRAVRVASPPCVPASPRSVNADDATEYLRRLQLLNLTLTDGMVCTNCHKTLQGPANVGLCADCHASTRRDASSVGE